MGLLDRSREMSRGRQVRGGMLLILLRGGGQLLEMFEPGEEVHHGSDIVNTPGLMRGVPEFEVES